MSKPLKLTRPCPLERDVQAAVLTLLACHPAVHRAWRVNSGAAVGEYTDAQGRSRKRWVRFNGQRAHCDIAGVLKGGRALFFETKRPGERPTAEQQSFLDDMAAGGALVGCVHSLDEAVDCLDRAGQGCALWPAGKMQN